MIRTTIEYYGGLKSAVGTRQEILEVHGDEPTIADVVAAAVAAHPYIEGALRGVAIALGDQLVPRDQAVADGDTVALLPPVCGG